MSHRSSFCLACSSRVNIYVPAFYSTIIWHLTVSQLELHSVKIPTTILDSESINILLVEDMIYSQDEWVFIRDLSDLNVLTISDAWWALMNGRSKCPIVSSNSGHTPLWRFYLYCGAEESGCPGIIYIICHRVLRHPSQLGTSSMGIFLLAKVHIAKLNNLTESEISELTSTTIDETTLAICKRQESCGLTIVSSQKKFIFNSYILSILTQWTDTKPQTGSKELRISWYSPRYLE